MSNDRIEFLAMKFLDGTATAAEAEELHAWYDSFRNDEELVVVTEEAETLDTKRDKIFKGVQKLIEQHTDSKAPVIPLFKRTAFLRAAAVIFMLGLTIIAVYLTQRETTTTSTIADTKGTKQPSTNNKQRIMLQLADGTTIALDSAGNGLVSTQGGTDVVKGDDGLTYKGGSSQTAEILYNSITIPKGQQFRLSLPDGSKVWLNSSSSLQFPVAFNGKERKVTLTGEGYFEIAKNPNQPFKVDVNGKCEVEVLGTHFNINAYDNEALLNTSLFEGKLRVTPIKNSLTVPVEGKVIMPGQQVQMSKAGEINIESNIDESVILAWKSNLFRFEEATIEEIMARAQQWYQIENIEYKGAIEDRFYSTISRDATLEKFLENLEKTGKVHFTLKGNTIEVRP